MRVNSDGHKTDGRARYRDLDGAGASGQRVTYRPFEPADITAARLLWETSEGIGVGDADEPSRLVAFLARNPGLSFVAATGSGAVVGTILCGHDGRRGLVHHLVIASEHRGLGHGRRLLELGLAGLQAAGIDKCHLVVYRNNEEGLAFWRRVGAEERVTLTLFSMTTHR